MDLLLTTDLLMIIWIEDWSNIEFFLAAWVLVIGPKRPIQRHFDLGWFGVDMAVAKLWNVVIALASLTFENVKIGPDLPVDLTPRNSIGLSNKSNEFLQIPSSVHHVLRPDLAVVVDVWFTLGAVQDLTLAHTEQLVAVGTFV